MNITSIMNAFIALNTVVQFPTLPPEILKLLGHSVIVSSEALKYLKIVDHPHILTSYGNVVTELTGAVIGGDGRKLFEQMAFLYSQKGWMERAIVIMVSSKTQVRFFKANWLRRTVNVIQFTDTGALITYNPFRSTFVKMGPEDAIKTMEERWKDMQGLKIPIVVYNFKYNFRREYGPSPGGGIDGTAIYELAKHWNMTVELKYVVGDEYRLARSNVMLLRNRADIAMVGRVAVRTTDEDDYVEFTTAAYEDAYVIALKLPTAINTRQIMGRIFGWKFWIAFFGSILIMNRAMFWITKQTCIFDTICHTISSLCNKPLPKVPKTKKERMILSSGFIVGFFIVAIFQASLFHYAKTTETDNRLKTLSEVYSNHNVLFTSSKFIKKYFQYFSPTANKYERPIREIVSNDLLEKHPVIILDKELKLHMATSRLRKDLYVVDEKESSFAMTYTVNRGSPLLHPLTKFTSNVFESGLSKKWFEMTLERMARKKPRKVTTEVHRRRNPGIEAAFCVLIFGNHISK